MPSASHDWNAHYRGPRESLLGKPSRILLEVLPLVPPGRALDIACGAGRNAIYLASMGWEVTAVDSSSAALDLARSAAQTAGIPVTFHPSSQQDSPVYGHLRLIEADLEEFSFPSGHFDLIVCTNYLQQSLFRRIEEALQSGGALLYETYTQDQLQFLGGPHNPGFLLHPGELRKAFTDLTILFYRELSAGKGIASILARKTR